ncbi:glycosyltransferase EpsD [Halanaerobium saccharolyticum]|uniref:Glycosyltransferase EpsD n=1 Tax=Halanaerobium saccharolyticum TaxID=43595 RepID=A0A2T5RHA5_9FIRM|nr:glycosyltransferase family 4 protein [Halanaerobium saccharolyticum]PTV95050.1 glycosyltransferase EpsD [Halanaerobium saccharolyticum]
MKKVLFTATVMDHIKAFHIPYINWLSKNNYKVDVACSRAEKLTNIHKVYKLSITRSPYRLKNLKAFYELKEIINTNNYDIIHCHTPMASVLTRLVAIKNKERDTKIIYTAHGFHFFKGSPLKNWLLYYPIEKILSNFTDVLITINKEDYHLAKENFKADKIEYINGIGLNTEFFKETKVNKKLKMDELKIPERKRILLSIGELNKNKNHASVIKALSNIDNNDFYYIICGKGKLKNYLLNLIKELNLKDKVKLLGYRNDINEILQISDIYIHPSFREGLPVSVMEAMASGLPVIASEIRGNIDLIEEDDYLINPSNIEEISSIINDLLKKDRNSLKKIGSCNIEKIKKYDIKNTLKEMVKIYKENS